VRDLSFGHGIHDVVAAGEDEVRLVRLIAAVVLAALVGKGTTRIDRVYEKIEQKLNAVGAQIERVKDKSAAA